MIGSIARKLGWSAAAGVVLAGLAFATTVQRLDFAGLTRLSTHVVAGTIEGSSTARTPDGGAIVTLSTLRVVAQWKGDAAAATLSVRTPGGRLGDEVMELSGSPELRPGDTVLLFLERNPDGTFGVISLAQGSFRVTVESDGSFWVERDPAAQDLCVAGGPDGKLEAVKSPLWAVRAQVDAARNLPAPDPDALPPGTQVFDLVEVVKGGAR
jgi:hypothetical protein